MINTLMTAAEIRRRSLLAMQRAVDVHAQDVLGEAKRRAPIDKGDLRANAYAEQPELSGDTVKAAIVFPEPYAEVQHERTDFRHPRGGEAKYLENAMIDRMQQASQRVGDELEQEYRRP